MHIIESFYKAIVDIPSLASLSGGALRPPSPNPDVSWVSIQRTDDRQLPLEQRGLFCDRCQVDRREILGLT